MLSDLSKSQRAVPASIEFVDIAGLVKGASQGEVESSWFLVVLCFLKFYGLPFCSITFKLFNLTNF